MNSAQLADTKEILFWASTGVSVVLGVLAVLGNGLVVFVAARGQNHGALRYLNDAVVSLAVTDLLTGLVGFPPMIVYYYWDLTNQFGDLDKWKLEAVWLLPNLLTTSTCLHALLLTSLRLLSLEMPMKYKDIHSKLKRISVACLWLTATSVSLAPLLAFLADASKDTVAAFRYLVLHGCHTLPLAMVVVLYFRVFVKANRSTDRSRNSSFVKNKKAARITGGVVFLILLSYIPYLAQWQMDILVHRDVSQITGGMLAFSWLGRCLMQLNSCVNPFIYAVILPAFRQLVSDQGSI